MLDIKRIKENPDAVKAGLKAKEVDCDATVDRILELDQRIRELKTASEGKTAQKNKLSKENGKLFGQKKAAEKRGEDTAALDATIAANNAQSMQLDNLPVLLCHRSSPSIWYLAVKRLMDIVLSLAALVLFSPFMLLTAILIKAYDGGPVLYKQLRLTKDRKEFYVYKFRSMRVDAEKDGVARLAQTNDDRITPVGRVIRMLRIDEMPQLFCILRGDMTIVGPRPERPQIAEQY